jgi:hypothetical protein
MHNDGAGKQTMTCQKTKTAPATNPTDKQTVKCVNVTKLTRRQRQKLFVDCMSQGSFSGFVKDEQNNQTFYVFCYKT